MNTYGGLRYSSTIPDLGTRWRWVVVFPPQSLYPRGKSLWHQLDRRLGRPQSRSGRCGEKFPASAGSRTPAVHPVARRYAAWAITDRSSLTKQTDKSCICINLYYILFLCHAQGVDQVVQLVPRQHNHKTNFCVMGRPDLTKRASESSAWVCASSKKHSLCIDTNSGCGYPVYRNCLIIEFTKD
jgi:hypothetical protein